MHKPAERGLLLYTQSHMQKSKSKLFVVRKYIKAIDAAQAIRKDKKTAVHDVWVDDEWAKGQRNQLADAIGFSMERKDTEDE